MKVLLISYHSKANIWRNIYFTYVVKKMSERQIEMIVFGMQAFF